MEYNISADDINRIFGLVEQQSRRIKMSDLIKMLKESGISVSNIVLFLKNLSIEDQIITRIISG